MVAHALNWRLAKTEIAKIIENGEPKIFICEGKFKDIKSELQKEIDFVDHWMEYGEGSDNSFEKLIDSSSCEEVPADEKGLIEISGPTVFKGYLNDPTKTKETLSSDGWLSTGDFGSLSEDGFISYHGRLKDMLKVGGENVAALEIESFYNNYEGVMISQVVGVDDERLGEVPALFIETKEGVTLTAEELIESAKGKISNFKIPRYVVFVDDWPMSSTKVQKFKLKDYDLGEKVFG